ncbi:hypothetical protein MYCTH_2313154 [Thermothelomyces thermophilus ATCC 42464]|uniref:Geranylgeranyl pyrophosphate synthetase n=1 Tax=Thermothelomyces thermophilus (strain ATCC 42464 / BCRC 31852 / DSM 1799) TaxID=573729 RepID=G2QNW0_THET4|nr:uncharacterized protein MYCTH_2313154 [Thermothelomyces thermophilus ATCC 42464]AEO62136.1 hypothetical protein MYCTH_2313154 [Thermothelomyces thermophilus ATCC 42464]
MAPSWYYQKPPSWKTRDANRARAAVSTTPPPPFGALIRTLKLRHLDDEGETLDHLARITDLQTVASYSWVDKPNSGPEILIPGRPPLWTPQVTPTQLKEDSGQYYRDKNAARYPRHPIEPAVVAGLDADPALPLDLDIFACKSTLGSLLSFVRGEDKEFRMLAYKVRHTIFLVRRENSPTELIPDVRGYGHTFPEANTTWEADVKGSASHQRLIRYVFGGLRLAVRFEADGYIKPSGGGGGEDDDFDPNLRSNRLSSSPASFSWSPRPSQTDSAAAPPPPPSLDELATTLSTANVTTTTTTGQGISSTTTTTSSSSSTSTTTTARQTKLTVTQAGPTVPIPHRALFDLKTRSVRTREAKGGGAAVVEEELPRLWAAQLPTLVLAYHARGLFRPEEVEVRDVRADLRRWEREHRAELARLAALLRRLMRDLVAVADEEEAVAVAAGVHAAGEGVVEICRRRRVGGGGSWRGGRGEKEEEEELEIRRPGGEVAGVLSDEVLQRWMSAAGDEGDSDDDDHDDHFTAYGEAGGWESDWESEDDREYLDFTACSADDCGYCGRCPY